MHGSREEVARSAADALEAFPEGALGRCVVGFDGFVDWIVRAVDRRLGPDDYVPIGTIEAFAARCADASGKSTNIELVDQERRWGGNGPLLAGGLAALGMQATFIGAVGRADAPGELDPVYQPLSEACEAVIPIGPPGRTEALEFDDGKIMLNRTASVLAITWESIVECVGLPRLRETVRGSKLLGLVNWSLMSSGEEVWRALAAEVLAPLPPPERPRVFVDLSDPAKRTDDAVRAAIAALREMNGVTPVTLGLNLSEAERLASVAGLRFRADHIADDAARLRSALDLDCVVVHPRHGAGGATAGERAWFDGPLTLSPRVSTGAGDHFNAGFAMARCAGVDLPGSLAAGCAASGLFVREACAPSRRDLIAFLRRLPPLERA